MAIKLITFDLDDTLWPMRETIIRMEERLYAWIAGRHPKIASSYDVHQLREKRQEIVRQNEHISHDLTAIRKLSFRLLWREFDFPPEDEEDFVTSAFSLYFSERNRVTLYEDVIPVLRELKQKYRLIAVSNGNADINRVGLGHLFECSWSAADAGVQKPVADIFHSLLDKLELLPTEVIHVGDDPKTDIQGAHNANIRSIWINRNHQPWPENISPPFMEINDLTKLPEILKAL